MIRLVTHPGSSVLPTINLAEINLRKSLVICVDEYSSDDRRVFALRSIRIRGNEIEYCWFNITTSNSDSHSKTFPTAVDAMLFQFARGKNVYSIDGLDDTCVSISDAFNGA